tara:strand:- start:8 stop:154 length:147 start_codon:yes stop_codon:yes gene_type:complete
VHSLGKKPIGIDKPLTVDCEKELQVDGKTYTWEKCLGLSSEFSTILFV